MYSRRLPSRWRIRLPAGFVTPVERIAELRRRLNEFAAGRGSEGYAEPELEVDAEVSTSGSSGCMMMGLLRGHFNLRRRESAYVAGGFECGEQQPHVAAGLDGVFADVEIVLGEDIVR